MQDYNREEKESLQDQNNLVDERFYSMLHPVGWDQKLMQQYLHQYQYQHQQQVRFELTTCFNQGW